MSNKDGGEGGGGLNREGGLINFPPLKRGGGLIEYLRYKWGPGLGITGQTF